ncbi:MAG: hypothetical protein M3Y05_08495 [Gemmatimonadota bacterium]|nr:hypothetical protein [Gemmatimonadota bacterium]
MKAFIVVGTFWICSSIGLVLFSKLRQYRIDPRDGEDDKSAFGFSRATYMSRVSYSEDGHALLYWFWAWKVLWLGALGGMAYFFVK